MTGFGNAGQQQMYFNHQKRTTVSSLGIQGQHGTGMQAAMPHNSLGKGGPIVVPQGGLTQTNQRMNVLSPNNGKTPSNQNSHQIVNNFLNSQDINSMSKTNTGMAQQS